MADGKWVRDVGSADFSQYVIEHSHERPVLVDFWAPWCGPCRSLGPVLEKLAEEMDGRFLLAKVNSDENQELGQHYGVRGIPAVKLFIGGEMVDEFTGALPESQVRAFLDNAIPSPADELALQGEEAEKRGEIESAYALYRQALTVQSDHAAGIIGLARVMLASDQSQEASKLLAQLSPADAQLPAAMQLKAQLSFAASDGATDPDELRAKLAKSPDDLGLKMALGHALVGQGNHPAGLDLFLEVMTADRTFEDDAGRKAVLQVFEMLGAGDPVVKQYRPKLSALLFS